MSSIKIIKEYMESDDFINMYNDYLKNKGIKALALKGGISFDELRTLLDHATYGNYKFLYLSPEKLKNDLVREKIKLMNINLIAVDEAHCISQWGHNFRPSYRLINEIREFTNDAPIIALTATANKLVAEDIQENLNFKKNNLIKSSFKRKNLSYVNTIINNKNEVLLKLLKKMKSSVSV